MAAPARGRQGGQKITLRRAEIIPAMFRHHFAGASALLFFSFRSVSTKEKLNRSANGGQLLFCRWPASRSGLFLFFPIHTNHLSNENHNCQGRYDTMKKKILNYHFTNF
jgi:hypothetical protein